MTGRLWAGRQRPWASKAARRLPVEARPQPACSVDSGKRATHRLILPVDYRAASAHGLP
jgi:hypothetical protein